MTFEENSLMEQLEEIRGILDREYFHVNTRITEQNKVEWVIYYKNLNEKEYFSGKNRPILTSKKNTVEDIYKLRDIFNNLIKKEDVFALFIDTRKIHKLVCEIKEKADLSIINIFTIYSLSNIIILFMINNSAIASILNLILCILIGIYIMKVDKKMSNLSDKTIKVISKTILKNRIRGKSFTFLKEIREELKKEGVYKYETYKKARETTNKSIL